MKTLQPCPDCSGRGFESGRLCLTCKGTKQYWTVAMPLCHRCLSRHESNACPAKGQTVVTTLPRKG